MTNQIQTPPRRQDWFVAGAIAAGVVACVVAFGFALLPGATRSAAPSATPSDVAPSPSLTLPAVVTPDADGRNFLWSLMGDPSVPQPDVSVVSSVSRDQWPDVIATCMEAAGFDAHRAPQNGVQFDPPPPDEEAAFAVAKYTCWVSYPLARN